MKKSLIIILFLSLMMLVACGRVDYLFGTQTTIEENATFNHYDYYSFKGKYTFAKDFSQSQTVKLVIYTYEDGGEANVVILNSANEEVYSIKACEANNGTYYIDLESGSYTFYFESKEGHKGEMLFTWNYQK